MVIRNSEHLFRSPHCRTSCFARRMFSLSTSVIDIAPNYECLVSSRKRKIPLHWRHCNQEIRLLLDSACSCRSSEWSAGFVGSLVAEIKRELMKFQMVFAMAAAYSSRPKSPAACSTYSCHWIDGRKNGLTILPCAAKFRLIFISPMCSVAFLQKLPDDSIIHLRTHITASTKLPD